jgi:hypothetical protein
MSPSLFGRAPPPFPQLLAVSLDYSRDSVIETVSIRVKGLLNWEND